MRLCVHTNGLFPSRVCVVRLFWFTGEMLIAVTEMILPYVCRDPKGS